ncbi:charged multivesicular body protein 4c-like [Acropora millepora]|uniref:charged multivesicular body protein 4c-like n=1 Tax=Acropora millepora TaxID=45264 RepID=UPI001CF1C3F8|nr:charged multivesicular body protein 4c-like [Acropora millepora]
MALAMLLAGGSAFLAFYLHRKYKEQRPDQAVQKAIHNSLATIDMLEKMLQGFVQEKDRASETARKTAQVNSSAAKVELKKEKNLENKIRQIENMQSTIRSQIEALENASTNKEVLKNLSYSSGVLQLVHQQFDVEHIHELMANIREQTELSNEICSAISGEPAEFDEVSWIFLCLKFLLCIGNHMI